MAFSIFPESSRSFCAGISRSHFWTWCACVKVRNMQICSWKCFAHAWKTRSKKRQKVSPKFPEENIASAKFHVWGKARLSLLIVHLQNCLHQKGDVSKHLRKHPMKSGLSSPLTRNVTLAWTLKFTVLLWNDSAGRQSSVIGKNRVPVWGGCFIVGGGGVCDWKGQTTEANHLPKKCCSSTSCIVNLQAQVTQTLTAATGPLSWQTRNWNISSWRYI